MHVMVGTMVMKFIYKYVWFTECYLCLLGFWIVKKKMICEVWKCLSWCKVEWFFFYDCLDNTREEIDEKILTKYMWCENCCPTFHSVETRKKTFVYGKDFI